ncbi:MAG: hypothetical protein LBU87_05330, partial [Lactobacillales bacterium]|nr:hypothetical protein [Lactobacillales bacterium]
MNVPFPDMGIISRKESLKLRQFCQTALWASGDFSCRLSGKDPQSTENFSKALFQEAFISSGKVKLLCTLPIPLGFKSLVRVFKKGAQVFDTVKAGFQNKENKDFLEKITQKLFKENAFGRIHDGYMLIHFLDNLYEYNAFKAMNPVYKKQLCCTTPDNKTLADIAVKNWARSGHDTERGFFLLQILADKDDLAAMAAYEMQTFLIEHAPENKTAAPVHLTLNA